MLLALTAGGLLLHAARGRTRYPHDPATVKSGQNSWKNFGLIVLAVLLYVTCVETVGFVLMSILLMGLLSWNLGARWPTAVGASVVFSVTVYQLFAHLLRVPLPRGWLGW
jgi:hypothetical protein